MPIRSVKNVRLRGQTVLVRVDFDVPLERGNVADDFRIRAAIPTIQLLRRQGCRVILMSHLGRPKLRDHKLSLAPVAQVLAEHLDHSVIFADDCVGPIPELAVEKMKPRDVLLLENLRFHKEEEANKPAFAKQLAKLADVYVDDAFAAMHRAHASIVGVPKYLPALTGLLAEREVKTITAVLQRPKQPVVAIVAGAKVSTKIEVLNHLGKLADTLMVGGAMANTFLAALGYPIGKSVYEPDQIKTAKKFMAKSGKRLNSVLPRDVVVTGELSERGRAEVVWADEVQPGDIIADIGPETIAQMAPILKKAGTIIWNGPLGLAEYPQFASASGELAKLIGTSKAYALVGGGDTASFIHKYKLGRNFDFISTGGGATLELLSGNKLPGWEALTSRRRRLFRR